MKFSYKARTKSGELQVGNVEATDREAAANILLGHELFVLSLELVKEAQWYSRLMDFFERVRTVDIMIFTRQFATLLASQVPIGDSLRNLYEQTSKSVLKEVIAEVTQDVQSGFSLSQALGRHPGVFSEFYVNMIKSAEVTGRLSEILDFLADYLEKQSILLGKVRNALIYPAFVIGLFAVVVVVMITMVLPQITPIFTEAKVQLPFFTRLLIGLGGLFSHGGGRSWLRALSWCFLLLTICGPRRGKRFSTRSVCVCRFWGKCSGISTFRVSRNRRRC